MEDSDLILRERREARAQKRLLDFRIRDMHERALAALFDPVSGAHVREAALARIECWELQRLCHRSYIQAWRTLLAMTDWQAMRSIVLADNTSAIALRQNTPFSPEALRYGHGQR